jgi:hypothetical protein
MSTGIRINSSRGVTISGCRIEGFDVPLDVTNSENVQAINSEFIGKEMIQAKKSLRLKRFASQVSINAIGAALGSVITG